MPITVTDSKGRKHSVSLLDGVLGGGRTIRRGRGSLVPGIPQVKGKNATASTACKCCTGSVHDHPSAQQSTSASEEKPQLTVAGDEGWSAEDDATLSQLKGEQKSWADIGAVLKRPKADLRKRWNQLEASETKKPATDKDQSPARKASWSPAPSPWDNACTPLPGLSPTSPAFVHETKDTPAHHAPDPWTSDEPTWVWGQPSNDETEMTLNDDEKVLLARLHQFYEGHMWKAISGRFFDRTGKRIAPTDLQSRLQPSSGW